MPLGTYTNLPTTMPIVTVNQSTENKAKRYELLKIAAKLLPSERVADCSRYSIGGGDVDLVHDPNTQTGHFENVAVCGSTWTCPVCASRLSYEKQLELEVFFDVVEDRHGTVITVAFTMQHEHGELLTNVKGDFNAALCAFKSGRSWSLFKQRYGIVGDVTAKEPKHGVNGWHYHAHVAFVSEMALNGAEIDEMRAWIKDRWSKQLGKRGRYASYEHGAVLTVQTAHDTANYISKWGTASELTLSEHKDGEGFTPFQLLDQVQQGGDGADRAAALFREYAEATKGDARIRFSRGLLGHFGLDKDMLADLVAERIEQAEHEAVDDGALLPKVVVASLKYWEWAHVVKKGARGQLLRYVARGKASLVWDFLESIGLPRPGSRAWVKRWLEIFITSLWSSGSRQIELIAEFERLKPLAIEHGLDDLYEKARQEAMGWKAA